MNLCKKAHIIKNNIDCYNYSFHIKNKHTNKYTNNIGPYYLSFENGYLTSCHFGNEAISDISFLYFSSSPARGDQLTAIFFHKRIMVEISRGKLNVSGKLNINIIQIEQIINAIKVVDNFMFFLRKKGYNLPQQWFKINWVKLLENKQAILKNNLAKNTSGKK